MQLAETSDNSLKKSVQMTVAGARKN